MKKVFSVIFLALMVAGWSQESTPKPVEKEKVDKVEKQKDNGTKILSQV
ncbi:hypothetical protein [Bacillus sp. FSL K6-3431]